MPQNIAELKEKRSAQLAEMRAIVDRAAADNRNLTDSEQKEWDKQDAERRTITQAIDRENLLAKAEREMDADPVNPDRDSYESEVRSFRLANAIQSRMPDSRVDAGRESEISQELAKRTGKEARGFLVPTEILLERRAITTGGTGSNLVATDLGPAIDRLRPMLKTEAMGATVLRNLTGDLDLPRLTSGPTAHWIGEHTNTTKSDSEFDKVSMGPKTVSGEMELSRRMILQSAIAIENLLRSDLGFVLAQALDRAAINGGGANEPTGILATAGIQNITGGAIDSDIAADLIAALELDDVTGTRAFLTNPKVMQAARKKKDADGHVIPISEIFHSERVEVTNQVPADIGTGSDKNALIYGQWADMVIGYWSAVDILVNPYHADVASKGGALIHAFLDADIALRHVESFAYAEID